MNNYAFVTVDGRRIQKHVHLVECAIGRKLRNGEEVHHANERKGDNRRENLVACQDREYHMLLHTRRRALLACGHADWRRCVFCRVYSPPSDLIRYAKRAVTHYACRTAYYRSRWRRRCGDPTETKRRATTARWASMSAEERTAQALRAWETRRASSCR